jgi:hypothetical protein
LRLRLAGFLRKLYHRLENNSVSAQLQFFAWSECLRGAWNSAAQAIECYSSPKNRGDAFHAPRSELLYPVTETNENLVGVAPNPTDVLNELQITFGEPANLSFSVNSEPTTSVAYDLNGN